MPGPPCQHTVQARARYGYYGRLRGGPTQPSSRPLACPRGLAGHWREEGYNHQGDTDTPPVNVIPSPSAARSCSPLSADRRLSLSLLLALSSHLLELWWPLEPSVTGA